MEVEGLDAIIVGPYDLSASMGITAKFNNSRFKKVLNDMKMRRAGTTGFSS